jgi:hypothetical protein
MMKNNLKKNYLRFLLILALISGTHLEAQKGKQGSVSISTTNVDVNTRTYLTSNISSGATSITVQNSALSGSNFSGTLGAGDLILIIQMQGASMNIANSSSFGAVSNYNSAGRYEFRCVSSVPNANTINFNVPLQYSYSASGHTQVIRVPRYSSLTIGSGKSIKPADWNGQVGGVTVIEVSGNMVLNGKIDASAAGFRGGDIDNNSQSASTKITLWYSNDSYDGGAKGEGIAGSEFSEYNTLSCRYGRGAPANGGGGGNSHNAGGGGGANGGSTTLWNGLGNPDISSNTYKSCWNIESTNFATSTSTGGGRGGYTYGANDRNATNTAPGNTNWGGNNRENVGGYGGRPLDYSSGRLFLGGGGGAGDGNNGGSAAGGNGGGMVIIIVDGNITGSGIIYANGEQGTNTTMSHNDAPGGGGGGGTIVIANAGSISSTISLEANGGNGGNQLITNNESEGPGGGGGGGYIAITSGSPIRSAIGGSNGTSTSTAVTEFPPNGATSGGAGVHNASYTISIVNNNFVANAGADKSFCQSTNLEAVLSPSTIGVWSVVSGTNYSISNYSDPNTIFIGDSSQNYILVWTVNNQICETKTDTVNLSSSCMPLPIQLLDFYGQQFETQINLFWTSASAKDFSHFEIQREINENEWESLGQINYNSNNSQVQKYQLTDFRPLIGDNNYRIKMIDLDGSFIYSNIITVEYIQNESEMLLYPAPASNVLNIISSGLRNSNIKIINSLGMEIQTNIEMNDNNATIHLDEFKNGIYILIIEKNNKTIVNRTFIIEKR